MIFSTEETQLLQKSLEEMSMRIENDEPLNKKDFSNKDLCTLYSCAYDLYQARKYKQAKELFHQLVISKPLKQEYWLGFGACLQLEKNYDEALRAWGMASILDGYDPTPHFHAAECCFALNDIQQGRNALKAAKKLITSKHQQLQEKIQQFENKQKKGI